MGYDFSLIFFLFINLHNFYYLFILLYHLLNRYNFKKLIFFQIIIYK